MPTTLHPGLYVQDAPPSERPTTPVGTSVAAFVGVAEKGPLNKATLISSWAEYQRIFGNYIASGYLAYAVRAFFLNGGSACYVVRIAKTAVVATKNFNSGATPVLTINALNEGVWGNSISVVVTKNTTDYDIAVYYQGAKVETWPKLTQATVVDTLANNSQYINAVVLQAGSLPDTVASTALVSGSDGITPGDTDYIGAPGSTSTGLYCFDTFDVNLVAIPGQTSKAVLDAVDGYCAARGDCFGILDAPMGNDVTTVKTFVATLNSTEYGAVFYPWVVALDPIGVGTNPVKTLPPSGYIAGLMARIDNNRGIWKAPAGTEATLNGVIRTERTISDTDQDTLDPANVNCIRAMTGFGIVNWGINTLTGRFLNNRRLQSYVKDLFQSNFAWTVFEPIDNRLLGKSGAVVTAGSALLRGLYRDGAFDGASETEAFFVKCDRENNPDATIKQGKLFIDVGYREKGTAKYVTISIGLSKSSS